MKRKERESFDERYSRIYGERWPKLRDHLYRDAPRIWRLNRFVFSDQSPVWKREMMEFPWAPECLSDPALVDHVRSGSGGGALEPFYRMDPASVIVAHALEVKTGMDVLDLCAAPGGKALILAEALRDGGRLVANELSRSRRFKLLAVFQEFLPAEFLNRVDVKGWDGAKVGLIHEGGFDRVLVDAPCSAEAHLIRRPAELDRWTPSRTKQLARRQYAILCSALLAVRSGGRIVYATCSLSPEENDGVIRRLLKRKGELAALVRYQSPLGAETEFGWQLLPDHHEAGPAYFSVIQKR